MRGQELSLPLPLPLPLLLLVAAAAVAAAAAATARDPRTKKAPRDAHSAGWQNVCGFGLR